MQQFALMLWRFVLMLIRIRRSKDSLEQFQEFECSSLFAFNYCLYWTTRYNTCGRIGTKWLFFFTFTEECCFVMEKNIGKKLPNRISDQVWYKRCLKETFCRGVQICEGGPYTLADLDRGSKSAGGQNPLWHRRFFQTADMLTFHVLMHFSMRFLPSKWFFNTTIWKFRH